MKKTHYSLEVIQNKLFSAVICDALDSLGYRNQSPNIQFKAYTNMNTVVGHCKTTLWADMYHEDPNPYELELKAVDNCQPGDILIAAAGNIYNDIIDFKVDLINKKSKTIINRFITKQTAIIWVFVLNSIALILGAYLCYQLDNYWLIILFFVSITLLILYSKWLKSIVLIGNVTVSILVSLSILIVAFFELTCRHISLY